MCFGGAFYLGDFDEWLVSYSFARPGVVDRVTRPIHHLEHLSI